MGAETRVRGRGRRSPALFELLALVVLLVLQGVPTGVAAAGRDQGHRQRRDVERECSAVQGKSPSDRDERDEDGDSVARVIACRGEAAAASAPDDEQERAADHDDSGDAEAHEPEDGTEPGPGDDEQEPDAAGDHDSEPGGQEGPEAHEPGEGGDDHDRQELDEADEGEPDDDDGPGRAIGDEGQENVPESDSTGSPQSGSGAGSPPADSGGDPGRPKPSGGGNSAGPVLWGSNLPEGATVGSDSERPKKDEARRPSDSGTADIDAKRDPHTPAFAAAADSGYNLEGSFSTAALLESLPSRRALSGRKRVPEMAPFIIAGPASWTDTWGAPRFGPGSLERRHEGQDVFCRHGDPVLANERGYLEFAEGGLGGRVARLHRADGSYWYYAHLSKWNLDDFASGDRVVPGDVIGYCGNSGNAAGSPPHVHFGFYGPDGQAINPMAHLIGWLRAAERNRGLDSIDGGDSSADPTPSRSTHPALVPRFPRVESIGDGFGDSSAVPRSTSEPRLSLASNELPQLPLALVAMAIVALGGFWSRDWLSSA
jgi:peptidoglycan LD-endopeptidase LytH